MKDCRLYVILDRSYLKNRDIGKICEALVRGGVDVVQYRDKSGNKGEIIENVNRIGPVLRENNIFLIVNDYPEIARQAGASGVHLGQDDMDIEEARRIVGRGIIGVSTHSVEEAIKAEEDGADYIAIGPVFNTPTKPELVPVGIDVVREVVESVDLPVFSIGGINPDNIDRLLKIGVERVVVCSAVLEADDIEERCKKLKKSLIAEPEPTMEER